MFKINKDRLIKRLEKLAELGIDPSGGWSRSSFSDDDLKARELLSKWVSQLGMQVRTDPAGNYIARLEGSNPELPAIAMGSHIDTVKNGGMFDGCYGVIAAIEAINTIVENNIPHKNPIELIVFAEEEGSGFGASLFGSKAMAGVAHEKYLEKKNALGVTLGEAMERVGCNPKYYRKATRSAKEIKSYLELHIEQGVVLDRENVSIGIVEGIVGFVWSKVVLHGKANHAGATPMRLREDAMVAAAEIIVAAERIAKEIGDPLVATVGRCYIKPNSINVIAENVEIYFDIRDISTERIELYLEGLQKEIKGICNKREIKYVYEELAKANPVILCKDLVNKVEDTANECGYSSKRMYSGAGHDAQLMSLITDVAMIFVPSKDGISHSPEEWTDAEDLEKGANVLLNTFLKLL